MILRKTAKNNLKSIHRIITTSKKFKTILNMLYSFLKIFKDVRPFQNHH